MMSLQKKYVQYILQSTYCFVWIELGIRDKSDESSFVERFGVAYHSPGNHEKVFKSATLKQHHSSSWNRLVLWKAVSGYTNMYNVSTNNLLLCVNFQLISYTLSCYDWMAISSMGYKFLLPLKRLLPWWTATVLLLLLQKLMFISNSYVKLYFNM